MPIYEKLPLLLANAISEQTPDFDADSFSEQEWIRILLSAKEQGYAHILMGQALEKGVFRGDFRSRAEVFFGKTLSAFEQMQGEIRTVSRALRQRGMDFVPLKGAVLTEVYPKPYMRLAGDMDVLVREKDIERAIKLLTEEEGFLFEKREYHNVTLRSPRGFPLELHFSLREDLPLPDSVLDSAWDYAVLMGEHEYRLSPSFTLFYIYAHGYYHFINGGCGVRPLFDGYLFEKAHPDAVKEADALLQKAGIAVFAAQMKQTALTWFGKAPETDLTKAVTKYLLTGGKFGSRKRSLEWQKESGTDWKSYRRKRIFLPYEKLCTQYPALKGKKILTPFFALHRLVKLLFQGKAKVLRQEKKQFAETQIGEDTAALFAALAIQTQK